MSKRKLLDLVLVLVIFALAGLTTVYVSDFILNIFKVQRWTPAYFVLLLLVMTPLHNVLLLFYAFLFRRFDYFWEKEKKMFKKIRSIRLNKQEIG
jgi:hypothetical protein